MRSPALKYACIVAGLLSLAACGSTSTPGIGRNSGTSSQGYYKVGKPYTINGITYAPAEDLSYDETGIASWYAGEFTGQPTANGELYDPNQLTAAHKTLPLPSLVRVTNLENGRALVVRINDRGPYSQARIIDLSRRSAQLLGFEQKGTAKVRVQIMPKESMALADAARHGQLAVDTAAAIETNPIVPAPVPQIGAPVQLASAGREVETVDLAQQEGGLKVVDEKAVIKQETGLSPKGESVGGRYLPAPTVRRVPVPKSDKLYIQAGAFSSPENAAKLKTRLASFGKVDIVPSMVNGKQFYRVWLGPLKSVDGADAKLDQVLKSGITDAKIVVE